jgi:hypothetical protein
MYADNRPCEICGSAVQLQPRAVSQAVSDASSGDEPVGPENGFVGGADSTVDERVCTNPGCPSRTTDAIN